MTAEMDADQRQRAGRAFVLDDEPEVGALVCKVLQACGFSCRQFTSPARFQVEVRQSAPELIVLDLSLGQSDAVEIIRHLEKDRYQGRVLLISGRDEATLNDIAKIGEKHGLAMLPPLQKPFRPGDIKQRLSDSTAAAVRSSGSSSTDIDDSQKVSVQLADALRHGWLELWYQPKIDLGSLSICGAEGLIRARHPRYGVITPDSLLPPPGDANYEPLTKVVIERAMADWREFAERGFPLKLSVNAPVSVIHTPAFIATVRSLLPDDPRFPGLTIEVTEDEIVSDSEWAREVASQLKLYNIDLSIDDFGSGYASLSRLHDLPFAEVKIDRAFVSGCASSPLKHCLCRTVIDLAHRCGATACGEGVDTIEDARALIAMRCDSAQGFLFGKPMPAPEFAATLVAGPAHTLCELLQTPSARSRRLAQSA